MKITAVRPWIVTGPMDNADALPYQQTEGERQFVFVQMETDEGLTGWGEITTYPGRVANRAVSALLREIGPLLVGRDPAHIEAIWQTIWQEFTYVGGRGAVSAAISGVDIALWDIRGQTLGVPIYQLLGGPVRERVPLYTHYGYAPTIDEAVASARQEVAGGAQAIKTDPFWDAKQPSIAYTDGNCAPAVAERGVETIAAVRAAVGPDIELLIDIHGMFNVPTTVRLAQRLAPYGITWFEEPVPPESYAALKQARDQIPMAVCVGERLRTRHDFVPVFEGRLADFVMPDVTWAGGISEMKKIATMAEPYFIPLSPHDASGPVNVLAGAQVGMTVPNFYRLETRRVNLAFYNALIEEPLVVEDGALVVPDRPGLGLTMNMDYFRAHALPGWGGGE